MTGKEVGTRPAIDHQGKVMPPRLARKRYRAAVSALGSYFDEVVEAVVLHEVPLAIAGQRVYGGAAGAPAKAVALDRLREGLHLLATHYGLLDERKRDAG